MGDFQLFSTFHFTLFLNCNGIISGNLDCHAQNQISEFKNISSWEFNFFMHRYLYYWKVVLFGVLLNFHRRHSEKKGKKKKIWYKKRLAREAIKAENVIFQGVGMFSSHMINKGFVTKVMKRTYLCTLQY